MLSLFRNHFLQISGPVDGAKDIAAKVLVVTVWVPPGLTLELWSCCGKVEHWVQLICCPRARLLLQISNGGQRSDVWRLRNVGVVTRIWRLE